jgi:hypothetical protein
METIKESLKILASVEKHRDSIDKYARNKYNERFDSKKHQEGTYHSYSSFDIISDAKIRVNYTYGGGDMDFNDSFTVEIE